jgi:hypothetical protein
MQYIFIPILVWIIGLLWVKWLTISAFRSKPKYDLKGQPVIYHGLSFYIFPIGLFAISIFLLLIPFLVPPEDSIRNLKGWVILSIFAAIICIPGVIILIEGLKANVTFTDEGIYAKAPWPGYPKTVLWSNIKLVSYSPLSSSIVIEYDKYKILRVFGFYYGMSYFCLSLRKHIDSKKMEKANKFIEDGMKYHRSD